MSTSAAAPCALERSKRERTSERYSARSTERYVRSERARKEKRREGKGREENTPHHTTPHRNYPRRDFASWSLPK